MLARLEDPASWGVEVVHLSSSLSLAILEILVHLQETQALRAFVTFEVGVPTELIQQLDPAVLPNDWRAFPAPQSTRVIGDGWAAARVSAVLAVPSVITPGETNYLLNPAHPDAASVTHGAARGLDLNPRLLLG